MMIGPTEPEPILPVPLAQQKSPDVVHASEVNVLIVMPLWVNGFQVTVVPLTLRDRDDLRRRRRARSPWPCRTWRRCRSIDVIVPMVTPLWVKACHVVPGEPEPVLEMIVAAVDEVAPVTKQIGCAVDPGQVRLP